jgi:phospho-N-acetylmuramoyl-pentapeptide-transferase
MQVLAAIVFVWLAQKFGGAHQAWVMPFGLRAWNPGVWYGPIAVLAILGAGNAVNITDGLDGLAGGASAIAVAFFAYLGVTSHDLALSIVSFVLMGGLVAFLRFNLHPASIFMGDTGSLSLGAALAGAALVSHTVFLLPVVGVLFVVETLSVILQVISFKLTGRRIFRMSPLHHHFELGGWTEERVVTVFWVVAVCGAAAALWLRIPTSL